VVDKEMAMLVLSRKCREAVAVGGSVDLEPLFKVTVLEINGRSVRLGFEAEGNLLIHRWEVWERLHVVSPPGGPKGTPVAPAV
jgi:carbon storage regulator CsrA